MRVKVCGITRPEDAELAVELGAWAIGFILWARSPRAADPAVAAGIARALRRRVEPVGVFVNASLDEVAQAADALALTHVQLHGDEGPAFCAEVARRTGARVIKAIRVADGSDFRDLERFHTDFHLLDTARARRVRRHGGDVGLGPGVAAPAQGAGDPLRRADAGERGTPGSRRSIRSRSTSRRASSPRPASRTPTSWPRSWPAVPRRRRGHERRGRASLRPLRRPVRPGDADAGARRAGGGVGRGPRRRRLPRRAERACSATSAAGRRRSTTPSACRRPRAGRSGSSART